MVEKSKYDDQVPELSRESDIPTEDVATQTVLCNRVRHQLCYLINAESPEQAPGSLRLSLSNHY